MMKYAWLILGISFALGVLGYWRYRQYPLPNPPAQRLRIQCATFFATRPSLNHTATFLKRKGVQYDQLSNSGIFAGNASTDFQRQHRNQIDSEIVFRVYDIKKPLCGRVDAMFVLSFDKRGQLLKAENMDWECCCLDF
jgi:hypothetical protein